MDGNSNQKNISPEDEYQISHIIFLINVLIINYIITYIIKVSLKRFQNIEKILNDLESRLCAIHIKE